MSFKSLLIAAGKDLGHVATWIDDGLAIATPIVGAIDPPLGVIFTAIEAGLAAVTTLDTAALQKYVTATAASKGVESCCCSMPGTPSKSC